MESHKKVLGKFYRKNAGTLLEVVQSDKVPMMSVNLFAFGCILQHIVLVHLQGLIPY